MQEQVSKRQASQLASHPQEPKTVPRFFFPKHETDSLTSRRTACMHAALQQRMQREKCAYDSSWRDDLVHAIARETQGQGEHASEQSAERQLDEAQNASIWSLHQVRKHLNTFLCVKDHTVYHCIVGCVCCK